MSKETGPQPEEEKNVSHPDSFEKLDDYMVNEIPEGTEAFVDDENHIAVFEINGKNVIFCFSSDYPIEKIREVGKSLKVGGFKKNLSVMKVKTSMIKYYAEEPNYLILLNVPVANRFKVTDISFEDDKN